jgi:hypothetical protein
MIDCYRVLGVSPHASQSEIRAAYIARMKVLHPDARSGGDAPPADASDISAAYWQLRTRERRLEHDRHLFASTSLAAAPGGAGLARRPLISPLPPLPRRPRHPQRRERSSRVLMGAAMGIVVLALAAPAGLFWMAHLYPIQTARATASAIQPAIPPRRPLDGAMRAAAVDDFATVVRDFGLEGARNYSRRCLAELSARASMTMLDYCIAFDDAAANWERPQEKDGRAKRFFADEQRSAQYRGIADDVREPEVRRAMLLEAGFFGRAPRFLGEAAAKLSSL